MTPPTELVEAAGRDGLEIVPGDTGPLALRPLEREILAEAKASARDLPGPSGVRPEAFAAALEELGRHRYGALETRATAAPADRDLRPLGELRRDVRLELEEQIGGLRAAGLEDRPLEAPAWAEHVEGIRALASTHNLLGVAERHELELGAGPSGAGVDELLDTVYRVISSLPGLESATDVADTVDARVREELAR